MAYDYKKAIQAGASEDQVLDYLNKTRGYNVQGALSAGASKTQLIDYLGNTPKPTHPIAPIEPPKAPLPLASKASGSFGKNLLTSAKDVGTGLLKFGVGVARDTAGMLQGAGQRLIAGFSGGAFDKEGNPTPRLEEVRRTTGFKSLNDSTPEGAGVASTLESKNRGEQVGNVLGTVASFVTPLAGGNAEALYSKGKKMYNTFQAGREAKATANATSKVTEMITPKPTPTQVKIAQSEGRLVEGKDPTLFKAGTDDRIIPSKKTLSATDTVVQKIPNASKMKPAELDKAVKAEISKESEALRPQMQATPIKPETIQKINTDWEALKKAQIQVADATEEANVIKLQKQFEERLQKSGSSNHNDLWETRVKYDDSIPESVKKAHSMSPESLQNKKEIWLQNRKILSDAITDIENGMGEVASKPFKEMSNLYEARNSLLSKAKLDKAQMSKINQFLADNPTAAKVLGGATLYGILRKLGVPLP